MISSLKILFQYLSLHTEVIFNNLSLILQKFQNYDRILIFVLDLQPKIKIWPYLEKKAKNQKDLNILIVLNVLNILNFSNLLKNLNNLNCLNNLNHWNLLIL